MREPTVKWLIVVMVAGIVITTVWFMLSDPTPEIYPPLSGIMDNLPAGLTIEQTDEIRGILLRFQDRLASGLVTPERQRDLTSEIRKANADDTLDRKELERLLAIVSKYSSRHEIEHPLLEPDTIPEQG